MQLAKLVDLGFTPLGDVEVTAHDRGSHRVYRGTIEKDDFQKVSDFYEFIKTYVIPDGFESYVIQPNIIVFQCDKPAYQVKVRVDVTDHGVVGHLYEGRKDREVELFFYKWGAVMNTLSFFLNIIYHGKWAYEAEIVHDAVKKRIPEMSNFEPYKEDRAEIGDYQFSLRNFHLFEEGYFVIGTKDGKLSLKRWEISVFDESWTEYIRKDVKDLELDIKRYEMKISQARQRISFMEKLDMRLQMTDEDLEKEEIGKIADKEERKEYYRNRPRNPALAKYHTRYLIDILHKGHDGDPFTEEDLRTELANRPHVPNKAERKLARQQVVRHGRNKSKDR